MKQYLIKLLEGDNGEKSTRRIAGMLLVTIGLLADCCLMIGGAFVESAETFTMYDKIENTAYNLIIIGAGLLASTTLDKLKDVLKR